MESAVPPSISTTSTSADSIADNLVAVRERILRACHEANRDPASVRLLAVSKTKPGTMVQQAIDAGQTDFGENYLQDALDKVQQFPDAQWHFIGRVQSNKTRQIANHFDWVHSLAGLKVARRLNDQRDHSDPLNVLLQVNISGDPAKEGVSESDASRLLADLAEMSNLRPRGLMTITEATQDPRKQRDHFRQLADLLDNLQNQLGLAGFDQLSMGMTADLESAIAEGATWVRIGTAIFGARPAINSARDLTP